MLVRSTDATVRPLPFVPAAPAEPRRGAGPAPRPQGGGDVFEAPGSGKPPRFEGLKDKALIQVLHDAVAKHKDIGYSPARAR